MDVTSRHVRGAAKQAQPRALTAPAAPPPEVHGTPTGPDLVLPTGVRIRLTRIGTATVTQAALAQAVRGIQLLPIPHQQLLARIGIPIQLLPVANLEQVPGTVNPVLGATAVGTDSDGRIVPSQIRIAAASTRAAPYSISEVVQHEIGHAFAVVGRQDTSEAAAERYAATY